MKRRCQIIFERDNETLAFRRLPEIAGVCDSTCSVRSWPKRMSVIRGTDSIETTRQPEHPEEPVQSL